MSWSKMETPPLTAGRHLVVDRSSALFLGSTNGRIWVLPDGDTKWREAVLGPDTTLVEPFAAFDREGGPGSVYARVVIPNDERYVAVFKSSDQGVSWRRVYEGGERVAPGPRDGTFVRVDAGGTHITEDDGRSWRPLAFNSAGTAMAIPPGQGDVIFLHDARAVRRSADGGRSWTGSRPGPLGSSLLALAASRDPRQAYAAVSQREGAPPPRRFLTETSDAGVTWHSLAVVVGGEQVEVFSVWASPGNPTVLLVPTERGLARSIDGGRQWELIQIPDYDFRFSRFAAAPSDPDVLYYASTLTGGTSHDAGKSWKFTMNPEGPVLGLAVDPVDPSVVYAAGPQKAWRSSDAMASWSALSLQAPLRPGWFSDSAPVVSIHRSAPEIIYVAREGMGLFKSVDGGTTWSKLTKGLDARSILGVALDPKSPNTVLANVGVLYRSTTGGE